MESFKTDEWQVLEKLLLLQGGEWTVRKQDGRHVHIIVTPTYSDDDLENSSWLSALSFLEDCEQPKASGNYSITVCW